MHEDSPKSPLEAQGRILKLTLAYNTGLKMPAPGMIKGPNHHCNVGADNPKRREYGAAPV